jgi:tetratricopeptide (TPR) repeat protein
MKIKFLIVFLFLMSSSFVFSAKYGKTDPDKLYSRALNFIEQERFFEAKKLLKAYTKSKPEDSYGWTLYAFSERKLGGLEKAKGLYEKALTLDADNKAALEYQGELFVELEMPALALANLEKLNILCPNSCEEAEQLKSFIAGTAVK